MRINTGNEKPKMENFNRKTHWENIYQSKAATEVSWYQPTPETSLGFLSESNLPATAKIIDIGGGDSFLVDNLLDRGYHDITVLDISETAIQRAKQRLGERAGKVKWIVADVTDFKPTEQYDFWHDRAAFHFLTQPDEISGYINTVNQFINLGGILVIGTFSERGPDKCSGIEIRKYSETDLTQLLTSNFERVKCITTDHKTPFGTIQNFTFCSFRRK
jgi:2-polyprenyl-3-methyl-5-hydroxy-6-metoxy-1,4-benzoquinol methylase